MSDIIDLIRTKEPHMAIITKPSDRCKQAADLHASGMTWKEVGERLDNVSAARARQLAYQYKKWEVVRHEIDGLPLKISKALKSAGFSTRNDVIQILPKLMSGEIHVHDIGEKSIAAISLWIHETSI